MIRLDKQYKHSGKVIQKEDVFLRVPDLLSREWRKEYRQSFGRADFLYVTVAEGGSAFTYLFDYARSRVVGVWGMPIYNKDKRDLARQKASPLGSPEGSGDHRGHLIAHSLGGGMDINFVPQLGRMNVGDFRVLERLARDLAKRGDRCLYAVRVRYADGEARRPSEFEQILVRYDGTVVSAAHRN